MIVDGKLTAEQRRRSQLNYNRFNGLNGLAYMCLGETVVTLFAIKMHASNSAVAAIGSMIFIGFIALPVGKYLTAAIGGVACQTTLWFARNLAALIVAGAAWVYHAGYPTLAVATILTGIGIFYGCRAGAVIMSYPLIGGFTLSNERSKYIGTTAFYFRVGEVIALSSICFLLAFYDSMDFLAGIIVCGSLLGLSSCWFLSRLVEPQSLRESARKPILRETIIVIANKTVQKQIVAGMFTNVALITCANLSILALKRGYQVSDNHALLYSAVMFSFAAGMSYVCGKFFVKGRKIIAVAYAAALMIPILWLLAPVKLHWAYAATIFAFAGTAGIFAENGLAVYYLNTVPLQRRISASIVIYLFTGAVAGLLGWGLSAAIFSILNHFSNIPNNVLLYYRYFFAVILLLLLPGFRAIYQLKDK